MYQRIIKRLVDATFSIVVLILTSPISLIIIFAIKIESKGPAFFQQKRTGKDGNTFILYKFRSMTEGNDLYDHQCIDEITYIGAFLRKTSLDEIPQLFNILKGDMSLIGPRPWVPEYYAHMTKFQRRRNDIRPGLTGLAQSKGRNSLTIEEKINFDLDYIDNISFAQDLWVIYYTLRTIFNEDSLVIGKGGIHDEISYLRNQHDMTSNGPSYDV